MITYALSILAAGALCAGWVAVQLLARKMKTKNHFDHLNSSCGHCTCGGAGEACVRREETAVDF